MVYCIDTKQYEKHTTYLSTVIDFKAVQKLIIQNTFSTSRLGGGGSNKLPKLSCLFDVTDDKGRINEPEAEIMFWLL